MTIRSMLRIMALASLAAAVPAFADCRSMEDLSEIPPGWHPVSVQWYGDRPDLVCVAKDGAPQMQVSHWKGFATPAGYYVLRIDRSLNPTFKGCAQFSEFQGVKTCMESWPTSQVAKNRGAPRASRRKH